jgi:hypothetical protein
MVPANQVFLVMGLQPSSGSSENPFVIFAGAVASTKEKASELFLANNPGLEILTVSCLSEMQDAVQLLTFVQQEKDKTDSSFPVPVYREAKQEIDAGQFGL